MAVILVTGASGQLGSEIKAASRNYSGYEFIFTDADNLDITDSIAVNDFISGNQPDWIINCAAYNFVDKAETDSENAFRINASAVKNLAESIRGTETRLIHVSTMSLTAPQILLIMKTLLLILSQYMGNRSLRERNLLCCITERW